MRAGKIKIIGTHRGGSSLFLLGQDMRVILETPDGAEFLIPAQSLTIKVGSRHERVVVTVEVPAVLVDIDGAELRCEAVVAPGGPESQWEESLGARDGDVIASAEQYVGGPGFKSSRDLESIERVGLVSQPRTRTVRDVPTVEIHTADGPVEVEPIDPMAELDAVLAAGGVVALPDKEQ